MLRGPDGVPRRERRHRHVAERGVDQLAGLPESRDVDTRSQADAGERLRERLRRRAVERDRDGVDRAADRRRAAAGRLERGCEGASGGSLAEQPDGQTARLPHLLDELAGVRSVQRARRVVDDDARRSQLRDALRGLDELVTCPRRSGVVHEPDRCFLAGRVHRLDGTHEVGDVVERIVDPEDVDPALGRARDEASDEVVRERAGADQEATAESHPERRLTPRGERADPCPRALDATLDEGVEAPSPRHLEAAEAGPVEGARQLEQLRSADVPGERLLTEEPDRRVPELGHVRRARCTGARACRP